MSESVLLALYVFEYEVDDVHIRIRFAMAQNHV